MQIRHRGLITPLTEPVTVAEVPPLPFMENGFTPPCRLYRNVFEVSGDQSNVRQPEEREKVLTAERNARRVCNTCPVIEGCRAYALSTRQPWGVWAGTTPLERVAWARRYREIRSDTGTFTEEEIVAEDLRRKFADVPTIELFSPEALEMRVSATEIRTEKRSSGPRSVAKGKCPSCTKEAVGVQLIGKHWCWRTHFYMTWGSERRQCAASGVAVCAAPEPEGLAYNGIPLQCPHEKEVA